jgi:hypothetical protein
MQDKDLISKYCNAAMDVILFFYPLRTTFGIMIGGFFWVVLHVFTPFLATKGIIVDWIYDIGCFIIGVLTMHIKTIIEVFNGDAISEKFGSALRLIDKRKDLSEEQKRLYRHQLISQHISSLSDKQIDEVEKRITEK